MHLRPEREDAYILKSLKGEHQGSRWSAPNLRTDRLSLVGRVAWTDGYGHIHLFGRAV